MQRLSKPLSRLYLLFFALVFLFFFRPGTALRWWWVLDEICYQQWLYRFLLVPHPGCYSQHYMPGIAIAWLPAGMVARLLEFAFGGEIEFWTAFTTGVTSFLFWAASLWTLHKLILIRSPCHPTVNRYVPFLFFLAIPATYYATMRTHLVHPVELWLTSVLFLQVAQRRIGKSFLYVFLLSLVRINAVPLLLVPVALALEQRGKISVPRTVAIGATIAMAPLVAVALYIGLVKGYNGMTLQATLSQLSFTKLGTALFARNFGIFWTQPFWLWAYALVTLRLKAESWSYRATWAWLTSMLLICLAWKGHGGAFGYRYLIGTYPALLYCYLNTNTTKRDKIAVPLLIYGVVYNHLLAWLFPSQRLWPFSAEETAGVPFGAILSELRDWKVVLGQVVYTGMGNWMTGLLWNTPWTSPLHHLKQHFLIEKREFLSLTAINAVAIGTAAYCVYWLVRERKGFFGQSDSK